MLHLRVVLLLLPVAAIVATAGLLLPRSEAAPPAYQSIVSAGPIEQINAGGDLSCQAGLSNVPEQAMFPQSIPLADCGTFLNVGSTLFAPDVFSHDGTGATQLVYTTFTPDSQSSAGGSGTAGDPYIITTVVHAGTTGLRITQVDSYVAGDDGYRTDVTVENSAATSQSFVLYRAGNCFVGGSNLGFGYADASTGAAGCATTANNSPVERFTAWEPITAADHYFAGAAATLWTSINQRLDLSDACACTSPADNAVGINWRRTLDAGASATFSHRTRFANVRALTMTKTADSTQSDAGGTNGYTIEVHNSNAFAVRLDSIEDTLPTGFTYVPGSSVGAYAFDPSVSKTSIGWFDRATIPAGDSVSQSFDVGVGITPGTFTNDATGTARGVEVQGVIGAAPVDVRGLETPTPIGTATVTPASTASATASATETWAPVP
ncbi:MAG: hypothetical protein WD359_07890, partial [Dehalococcoidia bacterium]